MAKYYVTAELSDTLKAIRIQKHITAKAVAEHIGKSQSYISKLERGGIKSIEAEELTSIFQFIFQYDKPLDTLLDSSLETILGTLQVRYSDKEIREQVWFDNYDTVQRLIPIPPSMIEDLQNKMVNIGATIDYLCERINANEGIRPEIINTDSFPFNEWQPFVVDHKIEFIFIKMNVDVKHIKSIFAFEKTVANYITMLSIVYYLRKIERFGTQINISDEADKSLMEDAVLYLNEYKFYSIAEINRLQRKAKTEEEQNALLSSFDRKNAQLIGEILTAFHVFSELNVSKMNDYLDIFVKNLKWDSGLMMSIISMKFYELDDTSFTIKSTMLKELHATLSKYKNVPNDQKRIDVYD